MNLRIVSMWLLFLFSIVIAFPGYGSSVRSSSKKTNLFAGDTETGFSLLVRVLKKCLSKGINMIEEERSTEEDEVGASVVFEYVAPFTLYEAIALHTNLFAYQRPFDPPTTQTIFTPPDCFFS